MGQKKLSFKAIVILSGVILSGEPCTVLGRQIISLTEFPFGSHPDFLTDLKNEPEETQCAAFQQLRFHVNVPLLFTMVPSIVSPERDRLKL